MNKKLLPKILTALIAFTYVFAPAVWFNLARSEEGRFADCAIFKIPADLFYTLSVGSSTLALLVQSLLFMLLWACLYGAYLLCRGLFERTG